MTIKLEFKKEDIWVGVFWKKIQVFNFDSENMAMEYHFWICLIPMLPIYITFIKETKQ